MMMAYRTLHKQAKPLGLQVFWAKTKLLQMFRRLLDGMLQLFMH